MIDLAANEVLGTQSQTDRTRYWPWLAGIFFCVAFTMSYFVVNQHYTDARVTTSMNSEASEVNNDSTADDAFFTQAIAANHQPDTALTALLGLWHAVPYQAKTACQSAMLQGLQCYQQQGNWLTLAKLNYPAVVYMLDDNEQPFYATLVAVKGEQLLLQLGTQQFWVQRTWFSHHFSGTFELFYKADSTPSGLIGHNSSLAKVQWLADALAQVYQLPHRPLAGFDVALTQLVKRFQRQHGLIDDGIAGAQTLIQLNLYLSQQGPRLSDKQEHH